MNNQEKAKWQRKGLFNRWVDFSRSDFVGLQKAASIRPGLSFWNCSFIYIMPHLPRALLACF